MFKTRITELFGIEYPIVGGCMMHISGPAFVAAISNAGALGMMASAMFPSQDEFRQAVRQVRSLTDKPFGVNLSLFPALRPIDNDLYIEVILEEGVPVEPIGPQPVNVVQAEAAGDGPHPALQRQRLDAWQTGYVRPKALAFQDQDLRIDPEPEQTPVQPVHRNAASATGVADAVGYVQDSHVARLVASSNPVPAREMGKTEAGRTDGANTTRNRGPDLVNWLETRVLGGNLRRQHPLASLA